MATAFELSLYLIEANSKAANACLPAKVVENGQIKHLKVVEKMRLAEQINPQAREFAFKPFKMLKIFVMHTCLEVCSNYC